MMGLPVQTVTGDLKLKAEVKGTKDDIKSLKTMVSTLEGVTPAEKGAEEEIPDEKVSEESTVARWWKNWCRKWWKSTEN